MLAFTYTHGDADRGEDPTPPRAFPLLPPSKQGLCVGLDQTGHVLRRLYHGGGDCEGLNIYWRYSDIIKPTKAEVTAVQLYCSLSDWLADCYAVTVIVTILAARRLHQLLPICYVKRT